MATATDAAPPLTPTNSKRKKSFYAEEEDIVVRPSTELIPDEYEHCIDESVLFHVFRTSTRTEKELAEDLLQSVQDIRYNVDPTKNLHELNRISELKADLETIRNEAAGKSALILFFIGFCGKEDGSLLMLEETEYPKSVHVKEVWNIFASNNCPELKYKPKIFIFCTSSQPTSVQTDTMRHRTMNFDKVYDFPAESDMLIVYKKVDDSWFLGSFFEQLCYNITNFSKKYDIIDLISYIQNKSRQVPLLISTLTRKFYLLANEEREHYLSIVENHNQLEEALQKIHDDMQKLQDAQKKKKDKKFSFSFKKKSEEKPKVVKRKDNPIVESPRNSTRTDGPNSGTPRTPSISSHNTTNRLSGSSATGRRSRQPSLSETAVIKRKPIWKI